jgi:2-polyprenyl-6-methoxyphenol hydroxylase-like FAD-dependent oxidoreductase
MAAVRRVLIVGAGIGGLTLAIALRQRGIDADVVEIEARVVGVGITLTGST